MSVLISGQTTRRLTGFLFSFFLISSLTACAEPGSEQGAEADGGEEEGTQRPENDEGTEPATEKPGDPETDSEKEPSPNESSGNEESSSPDEDGEAETSDSSEPQDTDDDSDSDAEDPEGGNEEESAGEEPAECEVDEDCPASSNACEESYCTDEGTCAVRNLDSGTPLDEWTEWGECNYASDCSEEGARTRTRTICRAGDPVTETQSDVNGCGRDTDGTVIREAGDGDWSECRYVSACDEVGQKTRGDIVCENGVEAFKGETSSEGCERNTNGKGLSEWTDSSECSYADACIEEGSKEQTRKQCSGGKVIDATQDVGCTRETDDKVIVEGAWGECSYSDECIEEGLRTRSNQVCKNGKQVARGEKGECKRDTDETVLRPWDEWTACTFADDCVETAKDSTRTQEVCENGKRITETENQECSRETDGVEVREWDEWTECSYADECIETAPDQTRTHDVCRGGVATTETENKACSRDTSEVVFTDWSEWTECSYADDCVETAEDSTRNREICRGGERVTATENQECKRETDGTEVREWDEWTECSYADECIETAPDQTRTHDVCRSGVATTETENQACSRNTSEVVFTDWSEWTECSYADECVETAEDSTRNREICENGKRVTATENQTCSRDTSEVVFTDWSDWTECSYADDCVERAEDSTRNREICRGGERVTATENQACKRETDGTEVREWDEWTECSYADECIETAPDQTRTHDVCRSGVATTETENQACLRDTSEVVFTDWSEWTECSYADECVERAEDSTRTREICKDGSRFTDKGSRACERSTDDKLVSEGEWGECNYADECIESGDRKRTNQVCAGGKQVSKEEEEDCQRDTSEVRFGEWSEWTECEYADDCVETAEDSTRTQDVCKDGARTTDTENRTCTRDTSEKTFTEWSEWTECEYADDCIETAPDSTREREVCKDGARTTIIEDTSCERDTSAVVLEDWSEWTECEYADECVEETDDSSRTREICKDGAAYTDVEKQACTRDTDEKVLSEGEWGDCSYTDDCSEDGSRSRSNQVCANGTEISKEETEEDADECVRDTDGVVISEGEWEACSYNDECVETGTRGREDQVCSNGVMVGETNLDPEPSNCDRDTEGETVATGEWSECSYGSTCVEEGTRSRSDQVCESGNAVSKEITDPDPDACNRDTDGQVLATNVGDCHAYGTNAADCETVQLKTETVCESGEQSEVEREPIACELEGSLACGECGNGLVEEDIGEECELGDIACGDDCLREKWIVFVDQDAPEDGAKDGSSWKDAFTKLEIGLAHAKIYLGRGEEVEVWVADGRYLPSATQREASFVIPAGVKVFGGFTGYGEDEEESRFDRNVDPETNQTVLSGDLLGNDDEESVVSFHDNSVHVVDLSLADEHSRLDGFQIRDGFADDSFDGLDEVDEPYRGAGIICVKDSNRLPGAPADPPGAGVLANLLITENRAREVAGVYVRECGIQVEESVEVVRNFAGEEGDGPVFGDTGGLALEMNSLLNVSGNLSVSDNFAHRVGGVKSWDSSIRVSGVFEVSNNETPEIVGDAGGLLLEAHSSDHPVGLEIQVGGEVKIDGNRSEQVGGLSARFYGPLNSEPGTEFVQVRGHLEVVDNIGEETGGMETNGIEVFVAEGGTLEVVGNQAQRKHDHGAGGWFIGWRSLVSVFGDAIVQDNQAANGGGGLRIEGRLTIAPEGDVEITENTAKGEVDEHEPGRSKSVGGGGFKLRHNGEIEVQGIMRIRGNRSEKRGGGFLSEDIGSIVVTGILDVSENEAGIDGGGFYNRDDAVIEERDGGVVYGDDNIAGGCGGGYFNEFFEGDGGPGHGATLIGDFSDVIGNKPNVNSDADACEVETVVVHVDQNTSDAGLKDGTSWADAFDDLTEALEWADRLSFYEKKAELWVADGWYVPTGEGRTASFVIPGETKVYGGFTGFGEGEEVDRSERNPDPFTNGTVLSGDRGGNDAIDNSGDLSDNSYHVVEIPGPLTNWTLDGFTVRDGHADGPLRIEVPDPFGGTRLERVERDRGAGVLRSAAGGWTSILPSTIANLRVIDNYAAVRGGGMLIGRSEQLLIEGTVTISNNVSGRFGGGFHSNSREVNVSGDLVLSNNSAGEQGGGLFLWVGELSEVGGGDVSGEGNQAAEGGGYYNRAGTMNGDFSDLTGNTPNVD